MDEKELIETIESKFKEMNEKIEPMGKMISQFFSDSYHIKDIHNEPLKIFARHFEYQGVSIKPAIFIGDTGLLSENIRFSIRYLPEYNSKEWLGDWGTDQRLIRDFNIRKRMRDDLGLEIGFVNNAVFFSRTYRFYLITDKYKNALPLEIQRFKRDAKIANEYLELEIEGKISKEYDDSGKKLIATAEEIMLDLDAKVKELAEIKKDEEKYDARIKEIEEQGYFVNNPFDICVWSKKFYHEDIKISIGKMGPGGENAVQFRSKYKPEWYEPPERPYCSRCAGEERFEETFCTGMHHDDDGFALYRYITLHKEFLPQEIERFRKDLEVMKIYLG